MITTICWDRGEFILRRNDGQLDLFNLFNSEPSAYNEPNNTSPSHFPSTKMQTVYWVKRDYGSAIEMYVKSGSTVNEICKQLIEEHNASYETFTTGKPKIYPYIMMYLDTLVEEGLCVSEQRDAYEGIFTWIEEKNTHQP